MDIEFTFSFFGDERAEVVAEVSADSDGFAVIEKAEFYTLRGIRAPEKMIQKLLKKIPGAWDALIAQATEAAEKKAAQQRWDFDGDTVYRLGGSCTGAHYLGRAA